MVKSLYCTKDQKAQAPCPASHSQLIPSLGIEQCIGIENSSYFHSPMFSVYSGSWEFCILENGTSCMQLMFVFPMSGRQNNSSDECVMVV